MEHLGSLPVHDNFPKGISSLFVSTNEPMPDVLFLTRSALSFRDRPKPSEIRLLIEASDTAAHFDLTTKARLYARAGIIEYWVVSLPDRTLTVHRGPQDGQYQDVTTFKESEQIAALAAPGNKVRVSRLLPDPDAMPGA